MRVFIFPDFGKENGQGGIKRVNEALHRWLPYYDIEIVNKAELADVVNVHADEFKTNKPLASSNHGLYWAGYDWQRWSYEANAKLIRNAKHAHTLSVPSKFVHNVFARGMLLDPYILYHGVEMDEWEPTSPSGYVFWGKTRLDPICSDEPLNILAQSCPDVPFVSTFGNPDLPNIALTGRMPYERSKEVLRRASVYLATVKETGGITVLEAMAAGIPPLGFAWGVNPELIVHKETGYLAPPGDYTSLREGLYYVLENRERLGENAREFVRTRHQWCDRIGDYIPFYEEAINKSSRKSPKVSIIVTAYNLESYLPACLDSILAQDFKDYEVIVVDDASPDNCGKIADEYSKRNSKVKVIHNSENQYLAEARNIGIRASSGQYILPLDADDMLGNGTLRILSEALDENRSQDIVTGGFKLIRSDGTTFVSGWPPDEPSFDMQIKHRNQMPYASMYRREWWERTGGYRRRWRSAEDAENWTRMMSYGAIPAKVTDIPTLVYNIRPDSMSHTTKEPNWTAWYSWAKYPQFTPFGASGEPEHKMPARHVLDYDPLEVSVVIPVGPNHEPYLQDCLDSLVANTFQNWKAIVVNDTGKKWFDEKGKPLQHWTQGFPFVEFLDDEGGNKGVAHARNRGIEASRTPLFALLDADDYLQPLAIDLMVKAWKQYQGWIYTDFMGEDGSYKEAQDFSWDGALRKMPCSIVGLYSRDDWERVGGFDTKITYWEDWDFLLSLMEKGVCGTRVKYAGFTYRYSAGNRRETAYSRVENALVEIREKHKNLYNGNCE